MVQGDQLFLHIGARAHLLRGTEKHPDLAAADFPEQLLFLDLGVCSVDIGYLFSRYTHGDQLVPNGVIDVEMSIVMRSREVTEDHLGRALIGGALPDLKDILRTGDYLAGLALRQQLVHQPLIQRQLAPIVGDDQHIVLRGIDHAPTHLFSALGQPVHHFLLQL